MGIDLRVLASHFREHRGEMLATAEIRLDRDPRLLSVFSKNAVPCIVQPIPEGLKVGQHTEKGLVYAENDSYGNRLTFTTSKELKSLRVVENLTDWNRAALAFLLSLPPETRIVLYWC